MNRILRCGGVLATLILGTSACAQTTADPKPKTDTSGTESTGSENPKTDLDRIGDTVENIGTKPLKDLNIIQAKVDPEIERIMEEPYSLKGMRTCTQYRTAIAQLTTILGPDVDSPGFKKKAKTPAEQALSLGESAAGSLIPFSGIIRRLSGAEAKQRYAAAAVYAGSVRRAYLKGTARAKRCKI